MYSRFIVVGFGFLVFGCGGSSTTELPEPTPAVAPAPAAEVEEASDTLGADVLAALAKADAKDGAEDKVVSKCALCSLHMDGSEDHVVTAGDYSLHMCSADCKTYYEEDSSGSLAKLVEAVK